MVKITKKMRYFQISNDVNKTGSYLFSNITILMFHLWKRSEINILVESPCFNFRRKRIQWFLIVFRSYNSDQTTCLFVICRIFWIFCSRLHTASWRQHQDRKPELQTGLTTKCPLIYQRKKKCSVILMAAVSPICASAVPGADPSDSFWEFEDAQPRP